MKAPKPFRTLHYSGVWLPFNGAREAFRLLVQDHLRNEIEDNSGRLEVDERGPHWRGKPLFLSYAHTENLGVLVYSRESALGVDVESKMREFKSTPLELAQRFFHPSEVSELTERKLATEQKQAFLELWVKKESFAKFTRLGLKGSLSFALHEQKNHLSETLPVTPQGFFAWVSYAKPESVPGFSGDYTRDGR